MSEERERSSYAQAIFDKYSVDRSSTANAFVESFVEYQLMVIKMAERAMELEGIPSPVRQRVINRIHSRTRSRQPLLLRSL